MSLPIARARRKKVPSIHRSPYLKTLAQSETESSKPSVVASQAAWSSATSQSSLTRRISEATRASSPSSPSSAPTIRSTWADTPRWTRVLCRTPERSSASRSTWRTSMPRDEEISCAEGRRPAHSSPYWRSRKNSSLSREERGRA